jgi:hypothetical protein
MEKQTVLVMGASGATGKHLVNQLLRQGHHVKVIVRSPDRLPESWRNNKRLETIKGSISDILVETVAKYLDGCHAVASCLGHNITFKGMYGKPKRLVTGAVAKIHDAAKLNNNPAPIRFVLMNTAGNSNRDLKEPVSIGQRIVIGLLRVLLPPHVDNEKASDYLRLKVGQNSKIMEWVAVRPDGLIDEEEVSKYSLHLSPTRSALFNPGKTSRINVGHFMAKLISDDKIWQAWKGRMPVIYNQEV